MKLAKLTTVSIFKMPIILPCFIHFDFCSSFFNDNQLNCHSFQYPLFKYDFHFMYFFFGLNSGVLAQSSCPHGWLKNDNSCYLFVTHVDNDWTESEVQCTISMPCPNDKHTGIISGIFRNSKKVYATHSEKIVSVFLSHDWIQTGRD